MANICNGQNQIHIILPWIVNVINEIVKEPENVWELISSVDVLFTFRSQSIRNAYLNVRLISLGNQWPR